jgi:catechol 2,3-dioxygenase-like lactoylglutathione lyase family enzyme
MERQRLKTGKFGLGTMIHSVHMTDDVARLNQFYEEVFGGLLFMGVDEPNYLPVEDRYAGLVLISDLCVETMAPKMPADPTKPVGKFYTKFGQHLHSVGYMVDDLPGLGNDLIAKGVYAGAPGGGRIEKLDSETIYFYPSPRDTCGLMVELCGVEMPGDPRLLANWSSHVKQWELVHPLGIKRLGWVTLGVRDLDVAVARYVELFEAERVHAGTDEAEGARFEIVHLGDALLRLAEPLEPGTPLGEHVARWGNMIYGITLVVRDTGAVQDWLGRHSVRTTRLNADLVAANPADTFGAPYFFTTTTFAGDPFA